MDANQARDLELIRQIRANVPGAMEALVEKYVPLVRHIARHHYAKRMDFEDLSRRGSSAFSMPSRSIAPIAMT